ncbi:MAG TPA: zf-HC2 domain-containing protein [Terriglobales bacterium]|nr:zf-HC2 domain-containing protein [Terriglobales bacterium]
MAEIPKLARLKLQTEQRAGVESHPDADLLNAFLEQAVTPREREQVLAHLSRCADCREAAALAGVAAPEAPLTTRPAAVAKKSFWSWGPLRWTAVAATAAVVLSAVWLDRREVEKQQLAAGSETLPQIVQQQDESKAGAASSTPRSDRVVAAPSVATENALKSTRDVARQDTGDAPSKISPQANLDSAAADNGEKADNEKKKDASDIRQLPILGRSVVPLSAVATSGPAKKSAAANEPTKQSDVAVNGANVQPVRPAEKSATELVAVAPAASAATPAPQPAMTYSRRSGSDLAPAAQVAQGPAKSAASNERILQRAPVDDEQLPAAGTTQSQLTMGPNQNSEVDSTLRKSANFSTKWRVTQAGELQQSFDSGRSWRTSLGEISNFRAVAAAGSAVWAGGDDGTLWRSSDYGQTWKKVVPNSSGRSPRGNIQSIQLSSPTMVVIKTSAGETWTSVDSGNSWSAANE